MSSGETNTSGRMNSITRRLCGAFARQTAGRILLSTVLLFVVSCAGWLVIQEHIVLGSFMWNAERRFFTENTVGGKVNEIIYSVSHGGAAAAEIPVGKAFVIFCMVFGAILLFRLFWMLLVSVPRYSREVRKTMEPLNELALKADELSRMEFGEDKYHLLEDAIANLDADESSKLTLGDSDLMGIEAAINNLLVRIRESNRQQARFVNDASHELRTPIAVIGGYADMLERWGKNDEKILAFCYGKKRTAKEIADYLGVKPSSYFRKEVLLPLVEGSLLTTDNVERNATFTANKENVFIE